jgi:hypothetical protein
MTKKDCCYKVMDDDGERTCDPYCPRELDDECPKKQKEGR